MICEISYYFVNALGWDKYGGSCVVNTSLSSTFLTLWSKDMTNMSKLTFTLSELTYLSSDKLFLYVKKGV